MSRYSMIDVIIITLLIYYYQMLPRPETIPKSKWSCMCFTLPELTGTCARDANQLGAFGLEVRPLPSLTKTLHEDRGLLWLVWSALPILTKARIWLRTCHCPPLPAIGLRHGDRHTQHSRHRAQHTADTTHRMNTFRKLMNCV